MNRVYNKILTTLLATVVVLSTLSVNIVMHFCEDIPISISYFGESNTCNDIDEACCNENETNSPQCSVATSCKDDHISEAPCCRNENTTIDKTQFTDNTNTNKKVIKLEKPLTPIELTNLAFFDDSQELNHYPPPLVIVDYQVLFQSFLI